MARLRRDASLEFTDTGVTMRYYDYYESPRRRMLLVADDQALTGVYFIGQKHRPRIEPEWIRDDRHAPLHQAKRELTEYFGGKRTWPPAVTRSASSCPATASSARTARLPATRPAWRKSARSWHWKGARKPGYAAIDSCYVAFGTKLSRSQTRFAWAIIFWLSILPHVPDAESRGYFSNFGSAAFMWSHGCASDVHTSTCGLNQLGSSRLAVLIATN